MPEIQLPCLILYFREYGSDKLYSAQVQRTQGDTYGVYISYGRFPYMGSTGWKVRNVDLDSALKAFTKIVTEKFNKGYSPIEALDDNQFRFGRLINHFDKVPDYYACIQLLRETANV